MPTSASRRPPSAAPRRMRQKDSDGCPLELQEVDVQKWLKNKQSGRDTATTRVRPGRRQRDQGPPEDLQKANHQGLPGDHQGEVGHRQRMGNLVGKKKATFRDSK